MILICILIIFVSVIIGYKILLSLKYLKIWIELEEMKFFIFEVSFIIWIIFKNKSLLKWEGYSISDLFEVFSI